MSSCWKTAPMVTGWKMVPIAAVIALTSGCGGGSDTALAEGEADSPPAPPPALVKVATVGSASGETHLWVTGALSSRRDARIAAEVSGRLLAVGEVGDRLKTGDMLARVDNEALQIQLRADEAEEKRLAARVDYLDKQLRRIETLSEQQIATRNQLDDLQSQKAMAEQDLEGARVAKDRTAFLLDRSTVRAPFSGRLVERLAQPGDYVTVGEEVARLVDTEHVEALARAPLGVASWVREGHSVTVEGAGETRRGTVRAAVPVGDDRSRMFEVRIDLGSVPWPVGTPLRVALPKASTGDSPAVRIPRDALILRRQGAHVFVLETDGTARRVAVVPGEGEGDWIQVEGELEAGRQVVVRGGERLKDGQKVQVLDPGASN